MLIRGEMNRLSADEENGTILMVNADGATLSAAAIKILRLLTLLLMPMPDDITTLPFDMAFSFSICR